MAGSLRDELLKAGLVTSEQVARAERGSRPPPKPAGGKATQRRAAKRRSRDAAKQRPPDPAPDPALIPVPAPAPEPGPGPAEPPDADPEAQVRQLNLEIRRILGVEAEKAGAGAETDTPFHFSREGRIKRLYVNEDQRRRLSGGELAIVGFGRRHHLVSRPAGEQIRALRPEVFVFIANGEPVAGATEEGYEGYEVPDGLVW